MPQCEPSAFVKTPDSTGYESGRTVARAAPALTLQGSKLSLAARSRMENHLTLQSRGWDSSAISLYTGTDSRNIDRRGMQAQPAARRVHVSATAGLTRVGARDRVRLDARSASDWDQGTMPINRGRVYPDGLVVQHP